MLITFDKIVNKYGVPKGIIHLGAHLAEELVDYLRYNIQNVVWVEGNPDLFQHLEDKIKNTKHIAISQLLSDIDDNDMVFNIAKNHYNNNYQSSSVLDFGTHEIHHPHIKMERKIKLKSKRLDTIFKDYNLKVEDYDFINIDLQGYELPAIKGFGANLSKIKYIYTEINVGEVYKGCTKLNELDEYLKLYNFERVETLLTDSEWGDAFYLKK
jgi:FkbM family methyltransferase